MIIISLSCYSLMSNIETGLFTFMLAVHSWGFSNFVLDISCAGTRSACINAATLALADAGIPMRDLVTSCSAGYLNSTPLLGICLLFYIKFQLGNVGVACLLCFVWVLIGSAWFIIIIEKCNVIWTDLNYVEDSAGGPDVTVGILTKLDKVTLFQVLFFFPSFYLLCSFGVRCIVYLWKLLIYL